jgi:hypothetical protein
LLTLLGEFNDVLLVEDEPLGGWHVGESDRLQQLKDELISKTLNSVLNHLFGQGDFELLPIRIFLFLHSREIHLISWFDALIQRSLVTSVVMYLLNEFLLVSKSLQKVNFNCLSLLEQSSLAIESSVKKQERSIDPTLMPKDFIARTFVPFRGFVVVNRNVRIVLTI